MLASSYVIILIEPQMGENIGAAARAMKNFGLCEMRLVNPRDGWPNEKADAMSVGAIDIIHAAKIFTNIVDAIEDISYLYAATATCRDMNKLVVEPSGMKAAAKMAGKIGVMFGRESSGLSNHEIAMAHEIVTIPTSNSLASMNIAHAVAVICYEISQINQAAIQAKGQLQNNAELVSMGQMNYFYEKLFMQLEEVGFFRVQEKRQKMQDKIRMIFNRIPGLSEQELQILYGMIQALKGGRG